MIRPLLAVRGARLAKNPGGAVYGAIVVTATIAAMSHHEERAWVVLVEAVSTLVVFWLAHVHSAIVSKRFDAPAEPLGVAVRDAVGHELPMLEVTIVPLGLLAASSAGLLGEAPAVAFALWAGVAELAAIGVLRGRRSGYGAVATIGLGVFYALTGGALVALKAALH